MSANTTVTATADVRVVGVNPTKPSRDGETFWILPNRWDDMILAPSEWPVSASRIHVAKFFPWWLDEVSNETLGTAVSHLNDGHVALALETGGLRPGACRGSENAPLELAKIVKVKEAGGVLSFVALDTPFGTTMTRANPDGCGYSAQEVSQQLVPVIELLRSSTPGLKIGLIEPVPWYWVGSHAPNPGNDFGDLVALIDTLTAVLSAAGERLDFFHADSPYDYAEAHTNGWAKVAALEADLRGRGIRFGLIYNSEAGGTTSDALYYEQTLAGLQRFWEEGGRPEDLIIQSWYPLPSLMVPESTRFTFSNVVRDFISLYDLLDTRY